MKNKENIENEIIDLFFNKKEIKYIFAIKGNHTHSFDFPKCSVELEINADCCCVKFYRKYKIGLTDKGSVFWEILFWKKGEAEKVLQEFRLFLENFSEEINEENEYWCYYDRVSYRM